MCRRRRKGAVDLEDPRLNAIRATGCAEDDLDSPLDGVSCDCFDRTALGLTEPLVQLGVCQDRLHALVAHFFAAFFESRASFSFTAIRSHALRGRSSAFAASSIFSWRESGKRAFTYFTSATV